MTTTAGSRPTRASVGLRSERGPVLLAVMLSVALVAVDATILATAVPAVVDDLGGFTQFPWLFSVYLLAQAVSTPLYAKLSDQFGRKPMAMVGIGLFVLGSLLCTVAWGMVPLIVFRAVQGLGAGAIQPVGMTILGDLYSAAERAVVQGYVAAVWAVSSVVGPTLGGIFADYLSWRWIFAINLPLGLVAAVVLLRNFDEKVARTRQKVDVLGSALLAVGGVALLLALLEGGVHWAWSSPTSLGLLALAVLALVAFAQVERRAAAPVLPTWVFTHRVVLAGVLGGAVVGVLMLGLTTYVPLYAQGVLGQGALVSGLALAAMLLGWPIAASNAGRLYLRFGYRATMLTGAVIATVGGSLLLLVGPSSPLLMLALPCFVLGLGFGLVISPSIVAAQTSVAWQQRGVATGTLVFSRSLGSVLGTAAFGALANAVVTSRLGGAAPSLEAVGADVLHPAVRTVFVASSVVVLLLFAAGLVMPRHAAQEQAQEPVPEPAPEPGT
ncbi:MDR family MFS transporter [Nocardioides bruguierae]|uniref:MDR family MFS transporter n=1 Tax=Nocardioides bruguierae TaxID=2945102 RepID=UPI00202214B3|nr:MDR family MFS transporter [Nocardioides bruguierae]MCL8025454.1 MFS transporter [Nocardioides bruguierae]